MTLLNGNIYIYINVLYYVNMNKHYKALELDKVLDLLASHTTCDDAADLARELKPSLYVEQVRGLLSQTDAAFCLMAKFIDCYLCRRLGVPQSEQSEIWGFP